MNAKITLLLLTLITSLAVGCKSTPDAAPDAESANTATTPAIPENAKRAYQGVESIIDGCDWGVYWIMNIEGTLKGQASWACEGIPPQQPKQLVVGDCVQLKTQRWCVHSFDLVDEGSDEPGSSEDSIVLVPDLPGRGAGVRP